MSEDGEMLRRSGEDDGEKKDDEDDDGLVENEGIAPKVIRDPGQPTAKQRQEHEVTHVPYRSWCPHCVRGRAKGRPRKRVPDQESPDIPRAAVDYCFFTRKGTESGKEIAEEDRNDPNKSQTVLVMKEATTHMTWAYPVDKKGVGDEEWITRRIVSDLDSAGLQQCKIVFKGDQESAIGDVQNQVAKKRAEQGHSTALQNSPVGDSDNNGRVEKAIQEIGGVARTLRSALEARLKQEINITHPLIPWLICQAANNLNRYQVRPNGRTAYRTATGRDSIIPVAEFGEAVHFRPPKVSRNQMTGKLDDKFETGIWVGQNMGDGMHIVGTPNGFFRVGDVVREPPDRRWSAELAMAARGTPKEPEPGAHAPGAHSTAVPTYTRHDAPARGTEPTFAPAAVRTQSKPIQDMQIRH